MKPKTLIVIPLYAAVALKVASCTSISTEPKSLDNHNPMPLLQDNTCWYDDFEDMNFDKWQYLLHPQGISIVPLDDKSNNHVAKITLAGTKDFLWNDNRTLNRSELQHKPQNIEEGNTSAIRWRFMLPELLSDTRHEIAYWESDGSYQQIMRFNVTARNLSFSAAYSETLWSYSNLKAQVWYDVEMHILWSASAEKGRVSILFNNRLVLEQHKMSTLVAGESAFIQLGILRDQQDLVETIYIDDVSSSSASSSAACD